MQGLLKSSGRHHLGMAFLSGALGFDPLAFEVSPEEAGRIVWFDALVNNVDRSWRNPNLLWGWDGGLLARRPWSDPDLASQLAPAPTPRPPLRRDGARPDRVRARTCPPPTPPWRRG